MKTKSEIQAEIACIDAEILKCQAWANYWVHFATSQANYNRKLQKSVNGEWVEMTVIEKEQDAFQIANNHITRIEDLGLKKSELVKSLPGAPLISY